MDQDWDWNNFDVIKTIITHPFVLVTKLIQIGYEPLPPSRVDFLIIKGMFLPNKFTYLQYIYEVDGLEGCFRGFGGELLGAFVSSVTVRSFLKGYTRDIIAEFEEGNEFYTILTWDLLATILSVVVSHPFHVASIRRMAELVGRETKYNGAITTLYTIELEEGLAGWFSGVTPRLIGAMLTITLTYGTVYLLNKFLFPTRDYPLTTYLTVSIVVQMFAYPFQVVSACMQVNDSNLKIASPPMMPDYSNNWVKCFHDLSINNQLNRGSSFFLRPYIPTAKLSEILYIEI